MASKRPKLPPEPTADPPKPRVDHIHVAPGDDGWIMRVGRKIEAHFDSPDEALDVAVPLARKRSARVFLHLRSGERREMATGEAEELLYQIWKDIHTRGTLPIYE
jgi:hypothetical protein